MARQFGRLKALDVARKKDPGLYPDGGGLYLQVTDAKSRRCTRKTFYAF